MVLLPKPKSRESQMETNFLFGLGSFPSISNIFLLTKITLNHPNPDSRLKGWLRYGRKYSPLKNQRSLICILHIGKEKISHLFSSICTYIFCKILPFLYPISIVLKNQALFSKRSARLSRYFSCTHRDSSTRELKSNKKKELERRTLGRPTHIL